jgi:hypothetical protein
MGKIHPAACCERGDELSGFVKGRGLFYHMSYSVPLQTLLRGTSQFVLRPLWGQHLPDEPVVEQGRELDCAVPEAASTGVLLLLLVACPVVQERNQQTAATVSWRGVTLTL